MKKNYSPYHIHSDYSLLDSCTKWEDYVDYAKELGQTAIASTEHGKPLGWVSKKMYCDKVGIKFLMGVEIYLTENLNEKIRDNYHTVLIAKNYNGVKELLKAVSISCQEDHFYYTNRMTFDEFLKLSSNVIKISACLASPLNKLPISHPTYEMLVKHYDYLEIQPHNHPDQKAYNVLLATLAEKYKKPLIAGTDTHSLSPYKAECREILLKAKRKSYGDEGEFDLTYKTYDELVEAFKQQDCIPENLYLQAIENTNVMADSVEDFEIDTSLKYPILYGSREEDNRMFKKTIDDKFKDKIDRGIIPKEQVDGFKSAIEEEQRVFKKIEMDGFMLSMSELISWCKENDIIVGPARGSVGGSRVAYVTDIIDLNPETWHTVFSRFANEDRKEVGDIDVDVIAEDRPKIFEYIINRFGAKKTARVPSYGTLAEKSVIDEIGRALMYQWNEEHERRIDDKSKDNPFNYDFIAKVKSEFSANPEKTKEKYPIIFYYYDGLVETKISQSVHPAGIVISPIELDDSYGIFDKDGYKTLMIDMDEIHECGLVKYDFLILKTLQIIRDSCRMSGIAYPKSHEVNWENTEVWNDMIQSPIGIFQMEGEFAHSLLRQFKPKNIFDMSLVTACIRPSGASYRNDLIQKKAHKNPSPIIDDLLKDNFGYLVYQEDIIKFLQQVCGLSGSDADNVRRAIARKDNERLQAALPSILDGYCSKSDKPRDIAEIEAKEFIQIIEDASSYMFGYNHSIAYCLIGYMCAWLRHYHPIEFITAFLNNAANEDDIRNGTAFANKVGVSVTMPKWGVSKSNYFFDADKHIIAKGLESVKYISASIADELYDIANSDTFGSFTNVLLALDEKSAIDARQTDTLIKIDFFSEFGNQRELFRITELFSGLFKHGQAKKLSKEVIDGTELEPIVTKYAVGTLKSGGVAKSYTLLDVNSIMQETERAVKRAKMPDLNDITKVRNFVDVMGYVGYVSGREKDRPKLYVLDIYPLKRKRDKAQFGYSVITKSIGSGIESRFTVFNRVFSKEPIKKDDIILCKGYDRDGQYFTMTEYDKIC